MQGRHGEFEPGKVQYSIYPKKSWLVVSYKVHIFWEGHENWQNLHRRCDTYLVNVKSTVKIWSNFVAFSENMNFNQPHSWREKLSILFVENNKGNKFWEISLYPKW